MHLAYIDESGSPGGSRTFTLACVLVSDERWSAAFDDLIRYRRFLRDRFGVPVRAEIKASHLLRPGGAFRELALSESVRAAIYRGTVRLIPKVNLQAFAVVVLQEAGVADPRLTAWEYLLQRLERFATKTPTRVLIVHDEGDADFVRKLARKARRAGGAGRAFGTGYLQLPFAGLIDDPVPRDSRQSYFLQLADLLAYAAFRRVIPPPPRAVPIVTAGTWDQLGDSRLSAVSSVAGGPTGIVVWPRRAAHPTRP